jgi:hypothetical protein
VDAFLVCSKSELQAECVEHLIKLQEQSEEHEMRAVESMDRLNRLMKTRLHHSKIPMPEYTPHIWEQLCEEVADRGTLLG